MTNILASTMVSRGIKHLAFIALMTLSCALSSQGQDCDWLLEGDLIFCCSDSANAITDVTRGFDLLPIDHVAIVHRIGGDDGPLYVIEAIKPAVCLTPIRDFVRANSRMIVGRVVADVDVAQSVRRCLLMVASLTMTFICLAIVLSIAANWCRAVLLIRAAIWCLIPSLCHFTTSRVRSLITGQTFIGSVAWMFRKVRLALIPVNCHGGMK